MIITVYYNLDQVFVSLVCFDNVVLAKVITLHTFWHLIAELNNINKGWIPIRWCRSSPLVLYILASCHGLLEHPNGSEPSLMSPVIFLLWHVKVTAVEKKKVYCWDLRAWRHRSKEIQAHKQTDRQTHCWSDGGWLVLLLFSFTCTIMKNVHDWFKWIVYSI